MDKFLHNIYATILITSCQKKNIVQWKDKFCFCVSDIVFNNLSFDFEIECISHLRKIKQAVFHGY